MLLEVDLERFQPRVGGRQRRIPPDPRAGQHGLHLGHLAFGDHLGGLLGAGNGLGLGHGFGGLVQVGKGLLEVAFLGVGSGRGDNGLRDAGGGGVDRLEPLQVAGDGFAEAVVQLFELVGRGGCGLLGREAAQGGFQARA